MIAGRALEVLVVIPDDRDHGVVRHAVRLARAMGELVDVEVDVITVPSGPGAADAVQRALRSHRGRPPDVVHLHVTDRLYGDDADEARGTLTGLLAGLGQPVVASLHDVPAPGDEPDRYAQRGRMYRAISAQLAAVIVSSEHERRLLERLNVASEVVPLPVVADGPVAPRPRPGRIAHPIPAPTTVGVLGFIYPGKGHDDVLDAMTDLSFPSTLVAIGRASDGHDDLTADLARRARRAGVGFHLTGFVPDGDIGVALAAIDVPVVPNRNPSASASLAAWVGHGRRPIVREGSYADEFAARCPGSVRLYAGEGDSDLATAIADAAVRPATTWTDGLSSGPDLEDVARRHERVLRRVVVTR